MSHEPPGYNTSQSKHCKNSKYFCSFWHASQSVLLGTGGGRDSNEPELNNPCRISIRPVYPEKVAFYRTTIPSLITF